MQYFFDGNDMYTGFLRELFYIVKITIFFLSAENISTQNVWRQKKLYQSSNKPSSEYKVKR